MIKKMYLPIIIGGMCISTCMGAESDVDVIQRAESYYNAIQSVCSNISDSISQISGVAKANTAVNAIGTGASGGALAVGIAKTKADARVDELYKELCSLGACNAASIPNMTDEQVLKAASNLSKISELSKELKAEMQKKKSLGNWRTGLMAGNVATNVASAIIAGINRDKSELVQQIQACNEAVKAGSDMSRELQRAGVSPMDNPIVKKLSSVTTWCGNLNIDNIEKIEKKMGAVMGTSIAGAAIGTAGAAVSATANSDKVDPNKEKALNTTANVISGVNAATGIVGVGLNISMINTAKDMIKQSERCEEVLK